MPLFSENTRMTARRRLEQRVVSLAAVRLGPEVQNSFTLAEIRSGAAAEGLQNWLGGDAWQYATSMPTVYAISASNQATYNAIAGAFPGNQNFEQRGYRVPRQNLPVAESTTLYVGRSKKIAVRLREHLGQAYRGTYALNLQRWCPQGEGTVTVRLQPILGDIDDVTRQDIEDAVWTELTPRYGKRGGR